MWDKLMCHFCNSSFGKTFNVHIHADKPAVKICGLCALERKMNLVPAKDSNYKGGKLDIEEKLFLITIGVGFIMFLVSLLVLILPK